MTGGKLRKRGICVDGRAWGGSRNVVGEVVLCLRNAMSNSLAMSTMSCFYLLLPLSSVRLLAPCKLAIVTMSRMHIVILIQFRHPINNPKLCVSLSSHHHRFVHLSSYICSSRHSLPTSLFYCRLSPHPMIVPVITWLDSANPVCMGTTNLQLLIPLSTERLVLT